VTLGIALLVAVSVAAARDLELARLNPRSGLAVASAVAGHVVLAVGAFFAWVPGPGTGDDYSGWFFLPPLLLSLSSLSSIVWTLLVHRLRESAV
jgi:hypothetical protein